MAAISQWWETLTTVQQVFWGIALFFTALFIFQFVINLIGIGLETDMDADTDGDAGMGHGASVDPGFTWLSIRGFIAFFTFFGWTGVIVLHRGGTLYAAVFFGLLFGFLAMGLVGWLLMVFARQTQSGNYSLEEAVYREAEVYLPVPADKSGIGKVLVTIGGGLREVGAVTEGRALPTGSRVRITGVLDDNLLLVEELRFSGV